MNIKFTVKNLELKDAERDYLQEKIEKLKKYGERLADESTQGKLEVEQDLKHASGKKISVTVTLYVPGDTLRAEVRASTVQEATDLLYEKLKSQALEYKAKTEHHAKGEKLTVPEHTEENEFDF